MASATSRTRSVYLRNVEWDEVDREAKRHDRSANWVVAKAVREYLKKTRDKRTS